jgi:hypothetical protein
MRIIVAIIFIGIICSLASALVFLMRDTGNSRRMLRALTVRIGLSALLFLLVLLAYRLGWMHPTGLGLK